jgi:NAD+ kinase
MLDEYAERSSGSHVGSSLSNTSPRPESPAGARSRKRGASGEGLAGREVLVVYKKSQLRLAVENKNVRITSLLEQGDVSVLPLRAAAEAHDQSVATVEAALRAAGCTVSRVYRARLRAEDTRGRLVVTVGGDGTVLDTSHRIADDSVVLGVNSDPARSIGFFCAATASTFAAVLDDVLSGALEPTTLQRLSGSIDGKAFAFPALNEVLIGHKSPASTSRYLVEHKGVTADHKSSGIYVATAAGSTAAMRSAGGTLQEIDDCRLQYRTRELLTLSPATGEPVELALNTFFFEPNDEVTVTSRMREGRVWIDGPHVSLDLPMGARLTLSGRCAPLHLVVTEGMQRRRAAARG